MSKPILNQINLVCGDVNASIAFYRRLGMEIPDAAVWRTPSGAHHERKSDQHVRSCPCLARVPPSNRIQWRAIVSDGITCQFVLRIHGARFVQVHCPVSPRQEYLSGALALATVFARPRRVNSQGAKRLTMLITI